MDRLDDIAVFISVIERMSFTAAAQAHHMTVSSVSKRITALEHRLGVQLINRSTRRLLPTEAGELFYKECARAVSEIERAAVRTQGLADELKGLLKIHAAPGVGYELVRDIILSFANAYPEINVHLDIGRERVNLLEDGYDVVIRSANLTDSSLSYREISPVRYFIVTSRNYLDRAGVPGEPSELAHHNCLINSRRGATAGWVFLGNDGPYTVTVSGSFRSNNGAAILKGVAAGLGVARVPEYLLQGAADGTNFEILFAGALPTIRTVKAFYPRSRHLPRKVCVFLDFLQGAMAEKPSVAGGLASIQKGHRAQKKMTVRAGPGK